MDVTHQQYTQIHPNKTTVDESNVFALLEQLLDKFPSVTYTSYATPQPLPVTHSSGIISVTNLFSHSDWINFVFQLRHIVQLKMRVCFHLPYVIHSPFIQQALTKHRPCVRHYFRCW